MFLAPVVNVDNVFLPNAIFWSASALLAVDKELSPIAILSSEASSDCPALFPIKIFLAPASNALPESVPNAILLAPLVDANKAFEPIPILSAFVAAAAPAEAPINIEFVDESVVPAASTLLHLYVVLPALNIYAYPSNHFTNTSLPPP